MQTKQKPKFNVQNEPRICVFSQRHLQRLLSACGDYEFEDLLCEFDNVDVLTAQPSHGLKAARQISNQFARRTSVVSLNPGVRKRSIDRDYELLFAKFLLQKDLLSLNALSRSQKEQYCPITSAP